MNPQNEQRQRAQEDKARARIAASTPPGQLESFETDDQAVEARAARQAGKAEARLAAVAAPTSDDYDRVPRGRTTADDPDSIASLEARREQQRAIILGHLESTVDHFEREIASIKSRLEKLEIEAIVTSSEKD